MSVGGALDGAHSKSVVGRWFPGVSEGFVGRGRGVGGEWAGDVSDGVVQRENGARPRESREGAFRALALGPWTHCPVQDRFKLKQSPALRQSWVNVRARPMPAQYGQYG